MTIETPSTEAQLREVLHKCSLPLAVVSLLDMKVTDANHAVLEALGFDQVTDTTLQMVISPDDKRTVETTYGLVVDGSIIAYEARRKLLRADGSIFEAHIWVRSLQHIQANTALVVFLEESVAATLVDDDDATQMPATRLRLSGPVVVGTIDLDIRVVRISPDVQDLLGEKASAIIGHPLVERIHRDDVAAFLLALGRAIADGVGTAMHVRIRAADDSYLGVRFVVTPTRGGEGSRLGFVMTSETAQPSSDGRVADLERHLWRIALEVQSAGVVDGLQKLPDPSEVPGLEDLSTRQWDIVTRLLRGERVPDIAAATFVSQSTVRNQLATIYRKLGVHSQAELLTLLRNGERQTV